MSTYQLRTYTMATAEAAERYASVHWTRHVPSLSAFGITTHGVWRDGDRRVVALVSYPQGADTGESDRAFMASAAFRDDMAGFQLEMIERVDAVLLEPAPASPLR